MAILGNPVSKKQLKMGVSTQNIETDIFSDFEKDLIAGLSATNKSIPSKYLYDNKGDRLFRKIMKLPEYYLSKAETEILRNNKEKLFTLCCSREPFKLIDLGVGDASKTAILIRYFYTQKVHFEFIPIDISKNILDIARKKIKTAFPKIKVTPINADYFTALSTLLDYSEKKLLLFLGSNLGNFKKEEAITFLRNINTRLRKGDMLLLGLDLKKDPEKIQKAYSDSKGITQAFNLNLLKRINTELHANFKIKNFSHYCMYNPFTGEEKSFLISKIHQAVSIEKIQKSFTFEQWEAIQTECSNKYDHQSIASLADSSNFSIIETFFDRKNYFTDVLLEKI